MDASRLRLGDIPGWRWTHAEAGETTTYEFDAK
jgi:hypothetical protein